jgi:hypothetical protein
MLQEILIGRHENFISYLLRALRPLSAVQAEEAGYGADWIFL